jgi:hypothetical protein
MSHAMPVDICTEHLTGLPCALNYWKFLWPLWDCVYCATWTRFSTALNTLLQDGRFTFHSVCYDTFWLQRHSNEERATKPVRDVFVFFVLNLPFINFVSTTLIWKANLCVLTTGSNIAFWSLTFLHGPEFIWNSQTDHGTSRNNSEHLPLSSRQRFLSKLQLDLWSFMEEHVIGFVFNVLYSPRVVRSVARISNVKSISSWFARLLKCLL